jgi:two-component sensor histidine kinase
VKNSLQVVSSIAGLEAHRTDSPETIAVLESMRSRIRAISLVHERLYSLEGGSLVDAGAYVRGLAGELSASLGADGGVSAETESIMLPVAVCVDMGLILSELVSNAAKHACPGGSAAPIKAGLRAEGSSISLRVEDAGPGLPEDFDPAASASLGMRLVTSLVKKQGAALAFGRSPVAFVEIRFPMPPSPALGAGGNNG